MSTDAKEQATKRVWMIERPGNQYREEWDRQYMTSRMWKREAPGVYRHEDGTEIICEGAARWVVLPSNPSAETMGPYPTLTDAKYAWEGVSEKNPA